MAPRIKPSPQLEALNSLAESPEKQTSLAIDIVSDGKDLRALRGALSVLARRPAAQARPALLARFDYLAADGIRRDTGGTLRAAIFDALRHIALPEDLPVCQRGVSTYEFLPPTRSEETWQLRAAALVVLNEVDTLHAAYHAVRLLADPHTSRLSGEPAVTAARVLAAQGSLLPLYYYVLHQAQPAPVSDVVAECLKSLAGLPLALILPLVEKYRDSDDDIVLVGLLDLAMAYEGSEFESALVGHVLQTTSSLAVYRYLATRIVSSHSPVHLPQLARQAQQQNDPQRLQILADALALGRPDPEIRAARAAVAQRLAARQKGSRQ
jgi:hypothetical protein